MTNLKINLISNSSNKRVLLAAFLIWLYYLYLNFSIPLYADDYWYSLVFGTNRHLTSIRDVWESQRLHYRIWGGRTVAHSIGQLALMGPVSTAIFRVLNATVFTGLLVLIARIGRRSIRPRSPGARPLWQLLFLNFALFWLFVPRLGETTLWLMGSVNYLWNAFFVLLYLDISGNIQHRHNFPLLLFAVQVPLGLLAGWGFESTSLTGLLLIPILLHRRRWLRQLPGFLAYLAGYILLITAPGNQIRSNRIDANRSLLSTVLDNIPRYVGMHALSWAILLLLLLLLIWAWKKKGFKGISRPALIFLAAGIFNNGIMLASPSSP